MKPRNRVANPLKFAERKTPEIETEKHGQTTFIEMFEWLRGLRQCGEIIAQYLRTIVAMGFPATVFRGGNTLLLGMSCYAIRRFESCLEHQYGFCYTRTYALPARPPARPRRRRLAAINDRHGALRNRP
jgi:hypothetical protein